MKEGNPQNGPLDENRDFHKIRKQKKKSTIDGKKIQRFRTMKTEAIEKAAQRSINNTNGQKEPWNFFIGSRTKHVSREQSSLKVNGTVIANPEDIVQMDYAGMVWSHCPTHKFTLQMKGQWESSIMSGSHLCVPRNKTVVSKTIL
jgi:hypothetical protein